MKWSSYRDVVTVCVVAVLCLHCFQGQAVAEWGDDPYDRIWLENIRDYSQDMRASTNQSEIALNWIDAHVRQFVRQQLPADHSSHEESIFDDILQAIQSSGGGTPIDPEEYVPLPSDGATEPGLSDNEVSTAVSGLDWDEWQDLEARDGLPWPTLQVQIPAINLGLGATPAWYITFATEDAAAFFGFVRPYIISLVLGAWFFAIANELITT